MTLLLGGPGSGKSTLLKVLSGRLKSKNFEVRSCWLTDSERNAALVSLSSFEPAPGQARLYQQCVLTASCEEQPHHVGASQHCYVVEAASSAVN
jgi:ABC-type multidrug transport system ATPase subunit